jgi:hypothetical protein
VRREKEREAAAARGGLPWPLYLVASCLVAIAAVRLFFFVGVWRVWDQSAKGSAKKAFTELVLGYAVLQLNKIPPPPHTQKKPGRLRV